MTPKVYWISNNSPGKLALVPRPRGNEWLEDEIADLSALGFDVVVSLLTPPENVELGLANEGDLVRAQGLTFISFPIDDYNVPNSGVAVAQLVDELDAFLSRGKTVGVHCRQSIGRSSVIVACLLARSIQDVDECFKLIEKARGTHVPDTIEQKNWVRSFAQTFVQESVKQ
jgi:protein-tyrosine phosphatase